MRRKIEINENWFFTKERPNLTAPDFSAMQEITLPSYVECRRRGRWGRLL